METPYKDLAAAIAAHPRKTLVGSRHETFLNRLTVCPVCKKDCPCDLLEDHLDNHVRRGELKFKTVQFLSNASFYDFGDGEFTQRQGKKA